MCVREKVMQERVSKDGRNINYEDKSDSREGNF